jgi:hypothetical protein
MALQLLKYVAMGQLESDFITRAPAHYREEMAIGEARKVTFGEGPEIYIVEVKRIDEIHMRVSTRRADGN